VKGIASKDAREEAAAWFLDHAVYHTPAMYLPGEAPLAESTVERADAILASNERANRLQEKAAAVGPDAKAGFAEAIAEGKVELAVLVVREREAKVQWQEAIELCNSSVWEDYEPVKEALEAYRQAKVERSECARLVRVFRQEALEAEADGLVLAEAVGKHREEEEAAGKEWEAQVAGWEKQREAALVQKASIEEAMRKGKERLDATNQQALAAQQRSTDLLGAKQTAERLVESVAGGLKRVESDAKEANEEADEAKSAWRKAATAAEEAERRLGRMRALWASPAELEDSMVGVAGLIEGLVRDGRSNVKRVFADIDKDQSGEIEVREIGRLLRRQDVWGGTVDWFMLQKAVRFIDQDPRVSYYYHIWTYNPRFYSLLLNRCDSSTKMRTRASRSMNSCRRLRKPRRPGRTKPTTRLSSRLSTSSRRRVRLGGAFLGRESRALPSSSGEWTIIRAGRAWGRGTATATVRSLLRSLQRG